MEVSLVLLTLLGSCCLGLVLLVILIVVVALLLSGRVKSAKVSGLGAGVELEAAEPARPPAEPTPGAAGTDQSTHHDHSTHIQADGDVAYGAGSRIDKRQAGVIIGDGATVKDSQFERVAGGDIYEAPEGE